MIHPATDLKFIDESIGYGVVATRFIPKGTITWVLDRLDRKFTREEIEALEPEYWEIIDKYTFRDAEGNWSEVETYVSKHSEAQFSHGLCPECRKLHYGGLLENS